MTSQTKGALIEVQEALEMISGDRVCPDNLMGNKDIANQALSRLNEFIDGVPKGLENGLMSISSASGTFIGETWGCMADYKVNEAAKQLFYATREGKSDEHNHS